MMVLVLLVSFGVLLAVGAPVAFAMIVSGAAALFAAHTFPLMIVVQRIAPGLDSFPLLAIPLFVLAGNLLNSSGIAQRIFDFASALVGHVKGGLAHVNVVASMIFAGMSGVASADAAGLGQIELKQMRRAGYDVPFAAAITAASSIIGPIIPPSVIMVLYSVEASVPLTDMFLAGLLPGVLLGGFLMLAIFVLAHIGYINVPQEERANSREAFRRFIRALPALLAPIFLLAGLFLGIATPTELGAIIALYAMVLGFVQGDLSWRDVLNALVSTVRTCGVLVFIVAAAVPFGWIVAVAGVSNHFAEGVMAITHSPWQVLLIINGILLIAGAFLETTALILIAIPVFLPTIEAIGVDPIHFGIILILNVLVGAITPPFGLILFVMMDVAKVGLRDMIKALMPFYLPLVALLILLTLVPEISLLVPQLLGGLR